ncbi:hypothetical protein [Streptomyces sp. NPDC001070]
MPAISSTDGSPPRRWALDIPGVRNSGSVGAPQFNGGQPEWLTTGFGLGYIGIAHTAQAKFDVDGTVTSLALYALCVALGMITGVLVRRLTDRLTRGGAKADRVPRIFGAVIVLAGMSVGTLPGTTIVPAASPHWTAQWLWIMTGALLVILAVIGEVLVWRFPATETAPAAVPAAVVTPARRPRRRRRRSGTA